jgi:hypothetical protein
MRRHHHSGTSIQRQTNPGYRRTNPSVFGDIARIVKRYIQVSANEHALASELASLSQPRESLNSRHKIQHKKKKYPLPKAQSLLANMHAFQMTPKQRGPEGPPY